jgi:ubiquinone/menaquinone biosynthesis C-methylase UbiE
MNYTRPKSQWRPTLHDRITLAGLHIAKFRRDKYQGNYQAFYEGFFSQKHVHQAAHDLRWRLRREAVLRTLKDLSGKAGNSVVCDIGCGVGDIIGAVPAQCLRIGVAYSEADLQLARGAHYTDVWFLRAAVEELPFPTGSIDSLICLEVIEHLPDDLAAIREMARVLRHRGQLIISAPSHYYFPKYRELIGHYRHYAREDLDRLLGDFGLRVAKYLDQQWRVNTLHYYPYLLLEGLHQTLNKCGVRADSLYVRRLTGSLYRRVSKILERLATEKPQSALSRDRRSTFLVAVKERASESLVCEDQAAAGDSLRHE